MTGVEMQVRMWWVWGILLAGMVCRGDGTSSTTSAPMSGSLNSTGSDNSTTEGNIVSIILDVRNITGDITNDTTAWKNLTGFLDSQNITYRLVALADDRTEHVATVRANITEKRNLSVTVNITDVSDALQYVNISEVLGQVNESITPYLLVNRCAASRRGLSKELFDFPLFNNSFYGYFINFTIDTVSNATKNLTLTRAISKNITEDHAYFITPTVPINSTIRSAIARRFCAGFVPRSNDAAKDSNRTKTSTSTTSRPATTISGAETTSNSTDNSTMSNNNSTGNLSTEIQSTTAGNVSVTEKSPVSRGHSSATTALAIILILVIVIVTCVVFRRRIINFLRNKVSRTRPIISTLGIAPYGTLRNEYDLEDFGTRRSSDAY